MAQKKNLERGGLRLPWSSTSWDWLQNLATYLLVTFLQEFDGGDTELDGVTDDRDLVGDERREIGRLLAQNLHFT